MLPGILKEKRFSSYEDLKKRYQISVPENFNFAWDVVDRWAQWDENKLALLWMDDFGNRREFTFADISRYSKKAANYFKSLGLKRGDMAMMMLGRRWEYWVCAVALHRMGVVLIPTSIQMSAKDITYRVNAAKIKMMVCVNDDYAASQIMQAKGNCPSLQHILVAGGKREGFESFDEGFESASEDYEREENSNDDLFIIYFTSGTTGMPKMVAHDFTYPLGHVTTAHLWHQCLDGGLHLTVSDSGWAKFGWGCIYGQWICGSAILGYDPEKFNARNLINIIKKERPTTVCVPPTIYRFMMKEGLTGKDFESVRHCTTAGEPLSPEVNKEFFAITGLMISEGFGQSESSVMCASFEWFRPTPGSMGKPSPLYDIVIIDTDGNECADGQEGELVVRGMDKYQPPGLLKGYYSEGEIISPFKEGNYHTGDVVWRDESGYFWFVGRNDDIIKCSGYRIGPFEIESVLLTHPAVHECAIVGAPDPIRGQVVKAVIVPSADASPCDALTKELQDYVKKMTAPYKYPRIIEYVPALPKTVSGKISRNRIRIGEKVK
ncbi:MAG: AMP-binding protein [Christensenellales bacterium]|jgi:acetyl-CoA synthetase